MLVPPIAEATASLRRLWTHRGEARTGVVAPASLPSNIYVHLIHATPIGDLPIEVAVRPTVSDGALRTQVVSVTAAGFELPVSVLDGLALSPGSGRLVDSRCLTLRDSRVEGNTVALSADAPRGCQ